MSYPLARTKSFDGNHSLLHSSLWSLQDAQQPDQNDVGLADGITYSFDHLGRGGTTTISDFAEFTSNEKKEPHLYSTVLKKEKN